MSKNSLPRRTTDLDKLTDAQRKEKAASKANADGLKGLHHRVLLDRVLGSGTGLLWPHRLRGADPPRRRLTLRVSPRVLHR